MKNCLDSLIAQDYPYENLEIIISDNNSTDNTPALMKEYIDKYSGKLKIVHHVEKRRGLVYVRNSGAKISSGDILFFGDDDGVYDSNWVSEIIKVYAEYPDVKAVGSKIVIDWDKEPESWIRNYEHLLGKLDYGTKTFASDNLQINGGSYSIRRETLFELGGFNPEQVGELYIGDGETGLCKRMHKKGYLVGWTPFTSMHHIQFVEKNGTRKDIIRRHRNNGICIPYNLFVSDRLGYLALIKNSLSVLFKNIPVVVLKRFKNQVKGSSDRVLQLYFEYYFYKAQLPYTFRILFNKEFRNYILKTNWF